MKRAIRYFIALMIIAFLVFLIRKEAYVEEDYRTFFTDRDSLSTIINIDRGMFSSKGFPIGFQYQMLTQYSMEQGCKIGITSSVYRKDGWERLIKHQADILAVDIRDTIPPEYSNLISFSIPMGDYAWALRNEDVPLLDNVNIWISYYKQKKEYQSTFNKFFRSYKIDSYMDNLSMTAFLSPYDDIIKRQSKVLGWDWRLLAAMIYQESRFSMNVHSRRGAVGLMQVIPATAEHYGITDIYNPEENVRAGVLHLRHLEKLYSGQGIDSANVVKFCLASYNAGEGRIDDCMNFTLRHNEDYKDWEAVSRAIPLMKDATEADYLRHGRFNGSETIKYVDDVLSKYEQYQFVVKP